MGPIGQLAEQVSGLCDQAEGLCDTLDSGAEWLVRNAVLLLPGGALWPDWLVDSIVNQIMGGIRAVLFYIRSLITQFRQFVAMFGAFDRVTFAASELTTNIAVPVGALGDDIEAATLQAALDSKWTSDGRTLYETARTATVTQVRAAATATSGVTDALGSYANGMLGFAITFASSAVVMVAALAIGLPAAPPTFGASLAVVLAAVVGALIAVTTAYIIVAFNASSAQASMTQSVAGLTWTKSTFAS